MNLHHSPHTLPLFSQPEALAKTLPHIRYREWWVCERSHILYVSPNESPSSWPLKGWVQESDMTLDKQSSEWLKAKANLEKIVVDIAMGEQEIQAWANTAKSLQKSVFLEVPPLVAAPEFHSPLNWKIKRILDGISVLILLVLLFPLLLVIAFLIKIASSGPVLFRQWRIGHQGKLFQILKFRTMIVNAEHSHHDVMESQTGLHKRQDDPRITPLGRYLRKLSLDELPQLFNVIKGQMSLVGPRPWALYDALRIPEAGIHRLNALPGITGPWQVSFRSQLLDLGVVTSRDLAYLHQWNLIEDLRILFLTIPKVISGLGAF